MTQQAYSKIETCLSIGETTALRILAAFACSEKDIENIEKFLSPPVN